MQILESQVEQKSRALAEKLGCKLIKIKGVRGFPDRILLRPNGQMTFIEFKRPEASLAPIQLHWQTILREMLYQAEEVDSVELFHKILLRGFKPRDGSPPSTKSEV